MDHGFTFSGDKPSPKYVGTRELMTLNRNEIDKVNLKMFRTTSVLSSALMLGLALFSVLIDDVVVHISLYFSYTLVYLALYLVGLLLTKKFGARLSLALMYIWSLLSLLLALYLGVYYTPDQPAVTFIVLLALTSSFILDYSARIAAYIWCANAVFVVCTVLTKDYSIMMIDIFNCLSFGFIGAMLGRYGCRFKMEALDNQRKLLIQRDTDVLTGLLSRRKLHETLSERGSRIDGVIMADIDFFKQYNDMYGHLKGDYCLELLGDALEDFSNMHGIEAYRYGGEEFIFLVHSCDSARLASLCEGIAQAIKSLNIPSDASEVGVVTFSLGYADRLGCAAKNIEQLIDMSDKALYAAKCGGRNRVVGYTPELEDM